MEGMGKGRNGEEERSAMAGEGRRREGIRQRKGEGKERDEREEKRVKVQRFEGPTAPPLHRRGEIWREGIDRDGLLHAKFHPDQCNVSPDAGRKTSKSPLSNLCKPTDVCAVRNLPVIRKLNYTK